MKPGQEPARAGWSALNAPPPSARLDGVPGAEKLTRGVTSYFEGRKGRRIYIQLDRPIYQPGETIWIKTWDLETRSLEGAEASKGLHYLLVSPRGSVVLRKLVKQEEGAATNDLTLPAGLRGGEYTIRVQSLDGLLAERPVIVSSYEPPRIKKKLEFLRKAYGPGDEVTATIEVKRPTGEALGGHALTAAPQLDGEPLPRVRLTTDKEGNGLVRFKLPAQIRAGDGLLTVLVEDGGVTESITRRIPILLRRLRVAFFPEGGELVAGLKTRVYFSAINPLSKPADIEGEVRDDKGAVVARFRSHFHGLGRLELQPQGGRTYHAVITRPRGIEDRFVLPAVKAQGCVLNSYDDHDTRRPAIVVRVRCTRARRVIVSGVLRERLVDAAAVKVPADRPAVVYLRSPDARLNAAQGAVRVTAFDEALRPLAERLVYRNRNSGLKVKIETDRGSYTPRDRVTVTASTTDASGSPVSAELALSVVDDTVVSFADDKTGHMLSRLYLEPEIPFEVHEPNTYFDPKNEKAARALDLLLGTAGYRRFAWRQALDAPPEPKQQVAARWRKWREPDQPRRAPMGPAARQVAQPGAAREKRPFAQIMGAPPQKLATGRPTPRPGHPRQPANRPAKRPVKVAKVAPAPAPDEAPMGAAEAPPPMAPPMAPMAARMDMEMDMARPAAWRRRDARKWRRMRGRRVAITRGNRRERRKWPAHRRKGERGGAPAGPAWAAVRVFPAPVHKPGFSGKRTDFRQTIHWAPRVKTDSDGEAKVSFHLSDAVTSFRVFAEGVGQGLAGRSEQVFKSSLPFSMHVKLPVEVSAGDQLALPVILTNETGRALKVELEGGFEQPLRLESPRGLQRVGLGPRQRRSLLYRVDVTGRRGRSKITFAARAGGLVDELERRVTVVPLGFPKELALSGEVLGTAAHRVDLGDALHGSIVASVRLYPSPVATMVSGLEGMIREPTGCFEQASSSNYPNVMVMRYLKQHRVDDAKLIKRSTRLLDAGYRKLTGYESKSRGYEWFGGDPGHEALTAYGLLQFVDMRQVYKPVDSAMVARTAAWLKARRDGSGGYQTNTKALDSFGRASREVTDAYITYSLTEARQGSGLDAEIGRQATLARTTKDTYLLALAANTLLNTSSQRAAGAAAARRLSTLQRPEGSWSGADHSITRSGGNNLTIETTALAMMALLKAGGQATAVRRAVRWLHKSRGGHGQWGTTQATVLALRAMAAHARAGSQTRHPGAVRVKVNGRSVGQQDYAAGHRGPLVFKDLRAGLTAGKNVIEVVHLGKQPLPYSVAISYRVRIPPSSPQAAVALTTSLSRRSLKMGETTRLTAMAVNRTDQGQPMTLARVGFPGGLRFQLWQLKELREKGLIAFYETRPREVILYFRQLKPRETRAVPIDLVAELPGKYTGPASRAYLYYTNEHKTWVPPQTVVVTR